MRVDAFVSAQDVVPRATRERVVAVASGEGRRRGGRVRDAVGSVPAACRDPDDPGAGHTPRRRRARSGLGGDRRARVDERVVGVKQGDGEVVDLARRRGVPDRLMRVLAVDAKASVESSEKQADCRDCQRPESHAAGRAYGRPGRGASPQLVIFTPRTRRLATIRASLATHAHRAPPVAPDPLARPDGRAGTRKPRRSGAFVESRRGDSNP